MTDPEICIVAAVRGGGKTIRCQRHFHGLMILNEDQRHEAEQGFITSRNRFVDRREGMRLQRAAGIESVAPSGYRGDLLFSEDLY